MCSSSLRTIAIASFIGMTFDSASSLFVNSHITTASTATSMSPSAGLNIFFTNMRYAAIPQIKVMIIICFRLKLFCIFFVVLLRSFLYSSYASSIEGSAIFFSFLGCRSGMLIVRVLSLRIGL